MRKLYLLLGLCGAAAYATAQVTTIPAFPRADQPVTIRFDASQGTGGLAGAGAVSIHMGALTGGPTDTGWDIVPMQWGDPAAAWRMTNVGPNLWEFTLTPNTFFGVSAGTTIYRLGMVFRSQGPCGGFGGVSTPCSEGKATGGQDIYVNLAQGALAVAFTTPTARTLAVNPGQSVAVTAAASASAALTLTQNGTTVTSLSGTTLSSSVTAPASGSSTVVITANDGVNTARDTLFLAVRTTQTAPAGTQDGITQLSASSVRLQLFAPSTASQTREDVFLVGDFSGWDRQPQYLMRRTPDGSRYWLELTGLTPGQTYAFQYWVGDGLGGEIRIADPYATLILSAEDSFIPSAIYPSIPPYPTGRTSGSVSVIQTNPPAYSWVIDDFTAQRPSPGELNVYELWVYDFTEARSFQGVIDSLDYLQRMGVNAIELMPVNEFAGNISWGYNPIFYFAVDKAYGTANKLKELVDEAHQRGIAVIVDVVFNQSDFEFPYVKMYWDGANSRPDGNSPMFNAVARHDFNVFFDMNHESPLARQYVSRACRYWLQEFKIDGFRFDLSKGFTQQNTLGNLGAWNGFDASRLAIWKAYRDSIRAVDATAYITLEHLGEDREEDSLATNDMMVWGKMSDNYKQASLGFPADGFGDPNLIRTLHTHRGFPENKPHLLAYMESHDEERQQLQQQQFGNTSQSASGYNTRLLPTSLDRMKLATTFFFGIPGAKLMWMWGEYGYDRSINTCPNGTISGNCRTDPKPILWSYLQDSNRVKLLGVYREMMNLRNNYAVFHTPSHNLDVTGLVKRINLYDTTAADIDVVLVGNFDVVSRTVNPNFPATGRWYDYFDADSLTITDATAPLTLRRGEIRLFTSKRLPAPHAQRLVPYIDGQDVATPLRDRLPEATEYLLVAPNPVKDQALLRLSGEFRGPVTFELVNLSGQVVSQVPVVKTAETAEVTVSTAQLRAGMYLAVARWQGGSLSCKLIKP